MNGDRMAPPRDLVGVLHCLERDKEDDETAAFFDLPLRSLEKNVRRRRARTSWGWKPEAMARNGSETSPEARHEEVV
jgi:hypothetical protein